MQKPVDQAGLGGSHGGTPSITPDLSAPASLNPRLARLDKAGFNEATRGRTVSLASLSGAPVSVLVVASEAGGSLAWAGFVNRCPHARWPLDRFDGQVMFDDTGALMCAAHFAVFDPLTGECLGGPGNGRPLTGVPVEEDGGELVIGPLPDDVQA